MPPAVKGAQKIPCPHRTGEGGILSEVVEIVSEQVGIAFILLGIVSFA